MALGIEIKKSKKRSKKTNGKSVKNQRERKKWNGNRRDKTRGKVVGKEEKKMGKKENSGDET